MKDVYLKLEAKYRDPSMLFHKLTDEANEKLGKTESIAIHRILRPHISIDSDSESLEAMQTEPSGSTIVTEPIPIAEDSDQEDDDIVKSKHGSSADCVGGAAPAVSCARSFKRSWKMRKIQNLLTPYKITKNRLKPVSKFPVGTCGASRVWLSGDSQQPDEDTLREIIAESGAEVADAA